jgi:hypothetical protein
MLSDEGETPPNRKETRMNRAGWKFALFLLTLGASLTAAGEAPGVYFSHEDWEIVCDNTRTCRMAGYCAEENYDEGCGSVLITRAAGPDTPLEGKATLADYGEDEKYKPPRVLTLWIDGKSKGKLNLREKDLEYPLTPTQIRALLVAAKNDKEVKFEGGSKSFTLSGKGISAVMLKMDEFQGRIGTPGALIRKGEKPEENALPPLPMPIIQAAKVSDAPSRALTAPEVTTLKPLLLQSLDKDGECYFNIRESMMIGEFTLTPLDEQHVLISILCWHTRYSEGEAYWVMDSVLKGTPKFVTEAHAYGNGMLYRGTGGGCGYGYGYGSNWVWNKREFRQSAKWHTGMCRNIHLGGAWSLPTLVTKIINEDGSPRNSD